MHLSERIKKQNKDLISLNHRTYVTDQKTKLFIEVDFFIDILFKELHSTRVLTIHNYNRKLDIGVNKQISFLNKYGFRPIIGSAEQNQRLMVMSNLYSYEFQITNKNKLRSFISKFIKN
jgi:hypothetical protein